MGLLAIKIIVAADIYKDYCPFRDFQCQCDSVGIGQAQGMQTFKAAFQGMDSKRWPSRVCFQIAQNGCKAPL